MREELEQINWNEELGNREKDINAQWNFIEGKINSGRSRISRWGCQAIGGMLTSNVSAFLVKMYVKTTELDPVGGTLKAPPGSINGKTHTTKED